MRLGLDFCFEPNANLGDLHRLLFDKYAKFTPEWTTCNRKVSPWNMKKHVALLQGHDVDDILSFNSETGKFFTSVIPRTYPYRLIKIVQTMFSGNGNGVSGWVMMNWKRNTLDEPDAITNNNYEEINLH